jgi:hypothetical protein
VTGILVEVEARDPSGLTFGMLAGFPRVQTGAVSKWPSRRRGGVAVAGTDRSEIWARCTSGGYSTVNCRLPSGQKSQ